MEVDGHALLLRLERLRGGVGLLHHVPVGEEGLQVEGVGPHLGVREGVFLLQPGPPRGHAGRGDEDRPVLDARQRRDVVVGHHPLQVVLERGRHGDRGQALLDRLEHLDVVAHDRVGLAREQELQAVDLGPAHTDLDVEAGLLVEAGGLGLVEAAVLGLGVPARQEDDLVRRPRRPGHRQRQRDRQKGGGPGLEPERPHR